MGELSSAPAREKKDVSSPYRFVLCICHYWKLLKGSKMEINTKKKALADSSGWMAIL